MQWSACGSFLAFAIVLVLVLIPDPDFAVVTKNALTAGRRRGVASLDRLREFLIRRPVRRSLGAVTGSVLLGFGARLAAEHA
jgi:threonine/homoserine/homoserine lactone efflux protein